MVKADPFRTTDVLSRGTATQHRGAEASGSSKGLLSGLSHGGDPEALL